MTKALPLTGMIVSGLIGVLFLADLVVGFPFRRASIALDAVCLVACLILGYLSWSITESKR